MREWPCSTICFTASANGVSISMATISTRGTMMSAALSSCSLRMLVRRVRSCASIGSSSSCSSMSSSSSSRNEVSPLRWPTSWRSQLRRPCSGPSSPSGGSAMGRLAYAIGIGDAEPGENLGLDRLHPRRLGGGLVVEAQEMQHAVDHEMRQMIGERLLLFARLGGDGLEGEHDVAEEARRAGRRRTALAAEGEHGGRLVL